MEKNIEICFHNISNLQKVNHLTTAENVKILFAEIKERYGLKFEIDELCLVRNSYLIQDPSAIVSDRDVVEIFPPYAGG